MSAHDVYSFGMVSSSTLYRMKGPFPSPDGYVELDTVHYMIGGEAANSSIVLSRLGASVKLDGNWIGADDAGKRTKKILANYGIDTTRLPLKESYEGASEMVFAAAGTRTIFGTYGRLLEGNHWNTPRQDDVTGAKVACIDPFFGDASARAAEIGFSAGIPVVTVDCSYDDPILRNVAAVVIAEAFIREHYADRQIDDLFRAYRRRTNGLVIFTSGDRAIRYGREGEATSTFDPFHVEPVDTTGAGDSFRAGVVYGFLQGWDDDRIIEFSAAVAALVCTRFPGVLRAPTYDEAVNFMRAQRRPVSGKG